jgi:hypothetical protein
MGTHFKWCQTTNRVNIFMQFNMTSKNLSIVQRPHTVNTREHCWTERHAVRFITSQHILQNDSQVGSISDLLVRLTVTVTTIWRSQICTQRMQKFYVEYSTPRR